VDARVARIFNTYGPALSLDDGRVISNLIVQALQNKRLTIYGDGTQTRSFCYVDDLIDGLMRMFFAPKDTVSTPINLGNPAPISMKKLAEEILTLIPSSGSEIIYQLLPEDDPMQRCPDISKAIKELDWMPRIDRNEGLKRTIDYFRQMV
jgi:UDP-glucuronate decarboxylase